MSNGRRSKCFLALLSAVGAALSAGGAESRAADPPKGLVLRAKFDRERYDPDDTMMILASFDGDPLAKVQFSDAGGGTLHFYLFVEPAGGKWAACTPIWGLQFEQWAEKRPAESGAWLHDVSQGVARQLPVHLPRLRDLAPGEYKLRVGYTLRSGGALEALIKSAVGKRVFVDEFADKILRGAFDKALLSEPVTIRIGPDRK